MSKPTKTDYPVAGFDMKFEWQTNEWEQLFDEQIRYIVDDVVRALADDRFVIYLSCPISPRGGGDTSTNVAIAKYTTRRLHETWGDRIFVLNPAAYQMESKEGRGLLDRHARILKAEKQLAADFDLAAFEAAHKPRGGDYMRMWTKVLVEDNTDFVDRKRGINGKIGHPRKGLKCGGMFDAYYFLCPSDVREFFSRRGTRDTSTGIEEHFAASYELDSDFRSRYDELEQAGHSWEGIRDAFVRYYTLRAGAAFSKGARDEWNIWCLLNKRRRAQAAYGLGQEIAGFWEGKHVDPASSMLKTHPGYEIR